MKRRGVGRSRALTARMVIALALLALTYAAVGFGVVELFREFPRAWPFWVIVALAIGATLAGRYRGADRALLSAVNAEIVERRQYPELDALFSRLSALASLPSPQFALAQTDTANAFTVGVRQRDVVVVLTSGIRQRLTGPELEAVVAHELSHVANRDGAVMTVVAAPRMLAEVMIGGAGGTTSVSSGWSSGRSRFPSTSSVCC